MTSKNSDLTKRLYNFSINSIKFSRKLPFNIEYKIIKNQLIKSVTSAGANYEEAQAGVSRADFHNKVKIALKETVESKYWFKLIKGLNQDKSIEEDLSILIKESTELSKILGSISSKTRK